MADTPTTISNWSIYRKEHGMLLLYLICFLFAQLMCGLSLIYSGALLLCYLHSCITIPLPNAYSVNLPATEAEPALLPSKEVDFTESPDPKTLS